MSAQPPGRPDNMSRPCRKLSCPLGLCLFASLAVICTAGSARAVTVADLDPVRTYKTAHIKITGNHNFSEASLLDVMRTKTRVVYEVWKPRPVFEPDTFAEDIKRLQRFYESHGYYGARVNYQLDINKDLVTARIALVEGQPVKVATIRVNLQGAGPRPNQLLPTFKLPLKTGSVFDEALYQLGQQYLITVYRQRGYAHAVVTRRAQVYLGAQQVHVWYAVVPGPWGVFGKTTVTGAKQVNLRLILRELAYKAGEPFDSRKIAVSREKILALNLFSSVQFDSKENPRNPAVVPIQIEVHERPKHNLAFKIGYNTETLLNFALQWQDYNFFGGGRQLTLAAAYSDVTSALDAKFIQPWLFSSHGLTLVLEAIQAQETYQTYTLNASRFDPYIQYRFSPHLTGTFGWRIEYLKFNSLDPSTISALGGIRRQGVLSGPDAGVVWNTTENPLSPQHGAIVSLSANASHGMFGGDYRYWRASAEARKYQLLGWQTVLATRLRLGLADTFGPNRDIPLSERFYSGGENSARGYGLRRIGPLSTSNDPLGGLSLVEGAVELRRPLFWKIAGAVFFDCGQVSTHSLRVPADALQCGYGPALSVMTPVGPMRVDLGVPTKTPRGDSNWQLYFSLGQFF
jgi:outer membrane protein assembly complex protein YaeT